MENIGFRILPLVHRPEQSLLERYKDVATPLLSDNMNRLHGMSSALRPYHKSGKLIGPAFTVKTRPGDNLMVHKAIDLAAPGDVVVVDAGGEKSQAIIGEIMMHLAMRKGIAGFLIDGCIRDSVSFYIHNFPCYAVGVTHRGPYKEGPGEINVPVTVGKQTIQPGDIIVGDEDGVISVPLSDAEYILDLALVQKDREQAVIESIVNGTVDRTWVDNTLRAKGCAVP